MFKKTQLSTLFQNYEYLIQRQQVELLMVHLSFFGV